MPYKNKEASRHHIPKQRYKVGNWPEYDKALQNRGRINLWMNDDVINHWTHSERFYDGTGSTLLYPDSTIIACHAIRSVLRLPLRQTEGFINSWFAGLGLCLKCPDASLLCRRLQALNLKTPQHKTERGSDEDIVAISIDSTGLKRYGRDEWHQEKHKITGKRSWRKIDLFRN